MEFFKYTTKTRDIAGMLAIYKMVWENKVVEKNAKNWYKGYVYYEDAMGDVFDGVMERFDPKQGLLENFTIKTLHTINKNKKKKEYNTSEAIEKKMMHAQAGDTNLYMELPTTFRGSYEMFQEKREDSLLWNTNDDMQELLPRMAEHFVRNFGVMYMKESKDSRYMPENLLEDYPIDTIVEAQQILLGKYGKEVYNFLTIGKEDKLSYTDTDKYKSRMDTSVICEGKCQGMWVLKRKAGSHKKLLYEVEIAKVIDYLWRICYSDPTRPGAIQVEGMNFYKSLSGKILTTKEELLSVLETEIVNTILNKNTYRIFTYTRGQELILSTTKEIEDPIICRVFGKEMHLELELVAVKEID